jgi:hypothetical protein
LHGAGKTCQLGFFGICSEYDLDINIRFLVNSVTAKRSFMFCSAQPPMAMRTLPPLTTVGTVVAATGAFVAAWVAACASVAWTPQAASVPLAAASPAILIKSRREILLF